MAKREVLACLSSGAKRAAVEANLDEAKAAGVTRVPAMLINDVTVMGNKTLQTYVDLIEEQLAR